MHRGPVFMCDMLGCRVTLSGVHLVESGSLRRTMPKQWTMGLYLCWSVCTDYPSSAGIGAKGSLSGTGAWHWTALQPLGLRLSRSREVGRDGCRPRQQAVNARWGARLRNWTK
jgi:hypothetical protein